MAMGGPRSQGLLDVGDGNQMYWECRGNSAGRTVVLVHGGPGSGRSRTAYKAFDHNVFQVASFDQRGCGGSVPSAADPGTDMSVNTTKHLLADMEALRRHLGVQRWLLYGGSWASTLILAYAQRYPAHVEGIILVGVTMTRPREIDWLYRGLRLLLPQQWERFRAGLPESLRDGNLVDGYRQLMDDPDPEVRANAAREWCAWEDAAIAHETQGSPGQYSAKLGEQRLAFVRICTHYFAHHAWLRDDELLRGAHLLAEIPGILIHGRLDLSAPLLTAWELARAWPRAELIVVEDAGHTGSPAMKTAVMDAITRFTAGDLFKR
ncbi:prolyl aminopeptidase [Mycolicibacterium komossense]|jgi:proline iminopeptidase|uniref:Proline iminopeptidase n=1 Tax=Mycolicibacterium komossense TaxID=1779 RepID=A0ABT3CF29_9MYCO|nr:prolyl aminopeptidase [Mycolicibacterium komossense]MCV7228080.1 prolyl aminopeptidase [Mycolicibacterium komossense]